MARSPDEAQSDVSHELRAGAKCLGLGLYRGKGRENGNYSILGNMGKVGLYRVIIIRRVCVDRVWGLGFLGFEGLGFQGIGFQGFRVVGF